MNDKAGRIMAVFFATFCVGIVTLMLCGAGIGTGHTLIDLSHLTTAQAESSITANDLAHGSLMYQDTASITVVIAELDDGTGANVQWNVDQDWLDAHVGVSVSDTEIDEGDAIDVTGTGTVLDPYVISVDVTDIIGNGLTEAANNLVVNAGDGIDVGADVAVDVSDFLGTGTYDDGSNNIAIGWTETGGGADRFTFAAPAAIDAGGVEIYTPADYPDPGETALAIVEDASYHLDWVNPDNWDDQPLWLYVAADTGDPQAALSTSDYLKFVGGTNIATDISAGTPPADAVIGINLDADIEVSTVVAENSLTAGDANTQGLIYWTNGGGESYSTYYPDLGPGLDAGWAWPTDAPAAGDLLAVESIAGYVAITEWLTPEVYGPNIDTKAITIEDPTNAEDIILWFSDDAITISQLAAILDGSDTPSVTYKVFFGADRSQAGTAVVTAGSTVTSITTGDIVTSFDDATIPADSWVWLTTTAKSGTVDMMNLTLRYSYDD